MTTRKLLFLHILNVAGGEVDAVWATIGTRMSKHRGPDLFHHGHDKHVSLTHVSAERLRFADVISKRRALKSEVEAGLILILLSSENMLGHLSLHAAESYSATDQTVGRLDLGDW